ncbi:recombinase family protein [Petroclostridium sp. X23]|uniref:recombinase family protein n=1 Tax=Petroclostridium sp. X23 TaxID=3045146 RepID=UPI0024ADD00A|nr:recombinase family protein [Petroclostridium sp. X23]WHH60675.1 recombinase family protein [Petroclostridium sp. X23]
MRSAKQVSKYVNKKEMSVKRVAAYCRVSTKHEEQRLSLKGQEEYYRSKISKNPLWELVGIYSDKASGRSRKGRKQFELLMSDCHDGKIDIILVKSISRFGRNTLETINALNELKLLSINVIFEIEKLELFGKHSDLMITIYAALYQNESELRSFNIKWGIERSFRRIDSKYLSRSCFGYHQGTEGELLIELEEAEIIKNLYKFYLEGKSLRELAIWLEKNEVKSPRGKYKWSAETINKILSNEKYTGNVLLQKTYVEDYLKGKQIINLGQKAKYYILNSHEAIISKEDFEKVQEEKRRRRFIK